MGLVEDEMKPVKKVAILSRKEVPGSFIGKLRKQIMVAISFRSTINSRV
jgi:hypothetical protein